MVLTPFLQDLASEFGGFGTYTATAGLTESFGGGSDSSETVLLSRYGELIIFMGQSVLDQSDSARSGCIGDPGSRCDRISSPRRKQQRQGTTVRSVMGDVFLSVTNTRPDPTQPKTTQTGYQHPRDPS